VTVQEVRRRPGGRSAQVRAAVLAAALEMLVENGFEGVTIPKVARRSGVHETSIYRRWGTRDRLILEAMVERSAELLRIADTGNVRDDLISLGRQIVDYGTAPFGEALMRTLASNADDVEASAVRARFWAARLSECQVLVERAKDRGEIASETDGRWLLELFIAPIHFRLLMTREPVHPIFLETLADAAVAGSAP
jgi:AcrR family transcriptional regulator